MLISNVVSKNNHIQTTDKQSALFDRVNEQDVIIGTITRKQAHSDKNLIHRAVIVLVFNSSGQLLLQKRSLTKDMYAGVWATSCSGHVDAGMTYEEAARQELWEELKIKATNKLKFLHKGLLLSPEETEFITVYSYTTDQKLLKSDEEIAEIKYFDLKKQHDLRALKALSKAPDLKFVEKFIFQ